ncbi:MAG: B12-binding domain-containing protein, partial [Chloroflexota bacterium]
FSSIQKANFSLGESDSSLGDLRGHWKEACLLFDENLAEGVINQAFAFANPETVCHEIFLKGMLEIGESWYQGKVSVQQEHFAAGVARRRLGSLISSTPPANRAETILVCCPPGEEHSLPGTCLTFLLRRQGYKVIDLGANVPIAQLKETAESIHPWLVILSAQQLSSAVQIGRCAQALADSSPIGFGGRIFKVSPGLTKHIPAYFLGDTLEGASKAVEDILLHKNHFSITDEGENLLRDLYEIFELNRHAIHSQLPTRSSTSELQGGIHDEITLFMNNSVAAALYFGDLDLLLPEMDWMEGFLHNRQYGYQQASEPWSIYIDSVNKVIGQEAAPILNWFDLHLSRHNQPGKDS